MSKIKTEYIVDEQILPLDIYLEKRNSLRVSFGRDSIIVRIPSQNSPSEQSNLLNKAKIWISKKILEKPSLTSGYAVKEYHGSKLEIMNDTFFIYVSKEQRETGKIVNKGKELLVSVPDDITVRDENVLIKKLLSRCVGSIYKRQINSEVFDINQKYFNKNIKAVKLKYNKSNWGSCSSKSNINLSTRLLLVPRKVREYVIIHELSHLIEMNHSERFWNIVESVCPEYKIYEKWLDLHGPQLDF